MIEVPIDYATPGDFLGKYHIFRKYELGLSSTVNLERGYRLTDRVIRKLKYEYRVQYLYIEEPSPGMKNVHFVESYNETEWQEGIATPRNVFAILKHCRGNFKILLNTFMNVQSHDLYIWEHSVNTAIYSAIIALLATELLDSMGITYSIGRTSRLENLVLEMVLRDVGKIKAPETVLNKPARLDAAELELMKRHPACGVAFMLEVNAELEKNGLPWIPSYLMHACLVHHPAYEGTGYPLLRARGGEIRLLVGVEVPLIGRIAAIADVYDAITSSRPFHPMEAVRILHSGEGKKLDPVLREVYNKNICPHPRLHGCAFHEGARRGRRLPGRRQVRAYRKTIHEEGGTRLQRRGGPAPMDAAAERRITPDSKVKILVNEDIYELRDGYCQ